MIGNLRLIVAVVVCLLSTGALATGGIESIIKQTLLDEISNLVPPILNEILKTVPIPTIQGQTGLPQPCGTLDYTISDIQIPQFNIEQSSTAITSYGFLLNSNCGAIEFTCAYQWKCEGIIKGSDGGTVDVTIQSSTLSLPLAVGMADGRPTVYTQDVQFNCGSLSFVFHGTVSWIFQDLSNLFAPLIQDAINKAAPGQIQTLINDQAEQALAKLQILVPWKDVLMNFTMTGQPYYNPNNYMSFEVNGEFEERYAPRECPFMPTPLPGPMTSDELEVYAGDYFINCALLAFYDLGDLNYIITQEKLGNSSFKLNTNNTDLRLALPGLYRTFPNDPLSIQVAADSAPRLHFADGSIQFDISGDTNISAILQNGTIAPALDLASHISGSVVITLDGNIVDFSITGLSCNISLLRSEIGTVEITILDAFIHTFCQTDLPDILDKTVFKKGVAIPCYKGFCVGDPQLIVGDGYAGVAGSLDPPEFLKPLFTHALSKVFRVVPDN